jgi:hypothetical protein
MTLQPRDEHEARAWYFAGIEATSPKWGPSLTERQRARRQPSDEEARDLEMDLFLMRSGSHAAMRRVVDFINRAR